METNLNWWQIIPRVTNYPWNWWQKNYPWNWYLKTVQKLPRQVSTNKPEEIRGQWANIISLPNFAEVLCPAIMAIKLAWQIRCEPRKPAKLNLKRWLMSISLFIIIPNPHRVASLHIIWGKKRFHLLSMDKMWSISLPSPLNCLPSISPVAWRKRSKISCATQWYLADGLAPTYQKCKTLKRFLK